MSWWKALIAKLIGAAAGWGQEELTKPGSDRVAAPPTSTTKGSAPAARKSRLS
jgi:hypothetical protein